MKHLLNTVRLFLVFAAGIFAFACSTSRQSGGFSYQSNANAPAISHGIEAPAVAINRAVISASPAEPDKSGSEIQAIHAMTEKISRKLTKAEQEKIHKISEAMIRESQFRNESGTPTTNRELVKTVTEKLVSDRAIDQISARDMKKLDRLAFKLDKKLQKEGKDIDVKNNTNLELFFMIMGIAGLILGILGVWVGWLLFVVFGGLWLYYKLVK
jgi:hypothetical protein